MNLFGKEITIWPFVLALTVLIILLGAIIYFRAQPEDSLGGKDSFLGRMFGGGDDLPRALTDDINPQSGESNSSAEGRLTRISDDAVEGATLTAREEKLIYFKTSTGHLFENEFDGSNETRLSNITIPAITNVEWSDSKEYAFLTYYNNEEVSHFYTRYQGTSTIESGFLSQDLGSLTFAPDEHRIAYTIPDTDEFHIITASPNNTKQSTIFSGPIPDFELSWPTSTKLALKTRASAFASSFLYTLPRGGGQLTKILGPLEGFDTLWSPTGDKFMYSVTGLDGRNISLNIFSMSDDVSQAISLVTLPEKCAWSRASEDIIYCAIPHNMPRAAYPDDWWQGNISFNDALWQINLATGEAREVLPAYQLDAIKLFPAADDSYLFFINKKDGFLWSLRIISE